MLASFLGLHFSHIWDLTAAGTLLLAILTGVLAIATFKMARSTRASLTLTRESLDQTKDEIALSRREVEEAHRPVLVPVVDATAYMDLGAEGSGVEKCPQLRPGGLLFIPVENIGAGPALNVEASVSGVSLPPEAAPDPQTPARVAGLGEGAFVPLRIELPRWNELWTFTLTVEYSDVAGKGWSTNCLFLRDTGLYNAVTVSEVEARDPSRTS